MDKGFSSRYLYNWLHYHTKVDQDVKSLRQLIEDSQHLAISEENTFEVIIPLISAPNTGRKESGLWLESKEVIEWLTKNGFSHKGLRQYGGLRFEVKALDGYSAASKASILLDRIKSRASVGSHGRIEATGKVWVSGLKKPVKLFAERSLEVAAIERAKRVFAPDAEDRFDQSLELLSAMKDAAPGAAIAGAWAAMESILTVPNEGKVFAADRLASLVACSFARAELTSLAWAHMEKENDQLSKDLRLIDYNLGKAKHFAQTLHERYVPLCDGRHSDMAAIKRILLILENPRETLADIKSYVVRNFRRIYRQRNMVLHWGRIETVALQSCLRTSAPLLGAGFDRIAHAKLVHGTEPLEIAARAENGLKLVAPGLTVVEILV